MSANLLPKLLNGAHLLGGVYRMDYRSAVVITDDTKKEACGGVGLRSFLLATLASEDDIAAADYTRPGADEVLLLSVAGVEPMPNEMDLVSTRLAAIEDAVEYNRDIDTGTKAYIEHSALRCDILGTFYQDLSENGAPFLNWGSDVDIVYSGTHYYVYAPSSEGLSYIASYATKTEEERAAGNEPDMLTIGVVRPTSTRKRAKTAGMHSAPVQIRVDDFISRKTAVLGMTRSGKSNTNKIIATAVFRHSRLRGTPIGQLIFDPQGEYANVNVQDEGTALKDIGREWVEIYLMNPEPGNPQQHQLCFNFFDPQNITDAHEIISDVFMASSSHEAGYAKPFLQVDLTEPDKSSPQDHQEWEKGAFAFFGLLAAAGFKVPATFKHSIVIASKLADAILADHAANVVYSPPPFKKLTGSGPTRALITSADGLIYTLKWICTAVDSLNKGKDCDQKYLDLEKDLQTWQRDDKLFGMVRGMYFSRGSETHAKRQIASALEYHNPNTSGTAEDKILNDLEAGKIVIVDMSIGSEAVIKRMAERIIRRILLDANDRFRTHREPILMQILVEEAHRLLSKDAVKDGDSSPWVRLAKEAAKYKIGLQFATQEVSSIDRSILAQTHNWLIAHLNSDYETGELGHYYQFSAWADQIRRSDDVGYVRMQTYSGKFVVPIQVRKFNIDEINDARQAAGLAPVQGKDATQSTSTMSSSEDFDDLEEF